MLVGLEADPSAYGCGLSCVTSLFALWPSPCSMGPLISDYSFYVIISFLKVLSDPVGFQVFSL